MPNHIENFEVKKGGVVNIHNSPHIIPKVLTEKTGLANDIDFVGRKEELQKVDELLGQNAMLLLLNGIGGIGKSTLASYYLNQHKDKFDYYGFVQVNKDIKLSLASAFSNSFDLKSEKIDDLFAEIMNKLQNLEGKKLLIIDDVKEMDNQLDEINTLMTLKNSGFKILFTSREDKDIISNKYPLGTMCVEDARELFLKHHATDEMEKVDKILEYLDCHTLFIEMTAKTLTKRKRTLSLDQMIEKFANGEFASIKKNRNESFNQFLNDLFANDTILQDGEILLFLKRLSVLPSIEISFEDLYKFLVCEDEERLEEFLIELVENGWLIESDGGYKFHQILKEFVWTKPFIFEEVSAVFNYFISIIVESKNPRIALKIQKYLGYYSSIHDIIQKFNIENLEVAKFYLSLGNIYNTFGNYKISLKFLKLSQKLYESILGENDMMTSTLNHNIGQLYYMIGEDDKALPLLLQDLERAKEEYDKNDIDFAGNYANIGNIYLRQGKVALARDLLQSALDISILNLGEKALETAIHYNNLGNVYRHISKYKESLKYYKKSIDIIIEVEGNEHPHLIGGYNNIGEIHSRLKEYKQALYFLEKGLELNIKIFSNDKHPNIGYVYGNIGLVYYGMKKYQKAYEYTKIATEIFENNFSESHPDFISAKLELERIEKKVNQKYSSSEIPRKSPCPCGSGKKYKRCCGE